MYCPDLAECISNTFKECFSVFRTQSVFGVERYSLKFQNTCFVPVCNVTHRSYKTLFCTRATTVGQLLNQTQIALTSTGYAWCQLQYVHRVYGVCTAGVVVFSVQKRNSTLKRNVVFQKNWSRECCASAAGPPRCSNEPPTPDIHISSFQSHFVQNLKILPASC